MKFVYMKRKTLRVVLWGFCFGFCSMSVYARLTTKQPIARLNPTFTSHQYTFDTDDDFARYIEDKYRQFDQAVHRLNTLVEECFDMNSSEPLLITCKRFDEAKQNMLTEFIKPLQEEFNELIATGQQNTVTYKAVEILLTMIYEMEENFDRMYRTIMSALHDRRYSSARAAQKIKPVFDDISSDANFKKLDDYLIQLQNIVSPYYSSVACDIQEMREMLEEIRQECRNDSTTSKLAILAMLRKRGPRGR